MPAKASDPIFTTVPSYRCNLVREHGAFKMAPSFACAADIHAASRRYMGGLGQEEFWVLFCDRKNKVLGSSMISRGILDASLVHPREAFRPAVMAGAASIVCVHNHPSGDPEPSGEDRTLTSRLVEAGSILGIEILDHVVVGSRGYVSFAERGWLQ